MSRVSLPTPGRPAGRRPCGGQAAGAGAPPRRALALPATVGLAALLLGGCVHQDFAREPRMSPVGYGLPPPTARAYGTGAPLPTRNGTQSLWDDSRADLFKDPRAARVGDIVTVNILINDKAQLDNNSDRSRESKINAGFDLGFAWGGYGKKGAGSAGVRSESTSKSEGMIDRSEKIQLQLAATVVGVMPNGNLIINGSQEVRVNYELRQLQIAGIVRPRDISRDNTIAYDKIAEARVSYGGRGRLTEIQQPPWGQQGYDLISPF